MKNDVDKRIRKRWSIVLVISYSLNTIAAYSVNRYYDYATHKAVMKTGYGLFPGLVKVFAIPLMLIGFPIVVIISAMMISRSGISNKAIPGLLLPWIFIALVYLPALLAVLE